ncbi:hypothetical protein [Roseateles sp.]|uniref:hypothetical protein n=1 Tax=Roseateles sp. TaxID=1971397 RepID=UPI0039EC515C
MSRTLTVELRRPAAATRLPAEPVPEPAPTPEPSATPVPLPNQAMVAGGDASAVRLLPEQLQAASLELGYPDALLPGGQLALRWWLRLNPDGSVAALSSNATTNSPEYFVSAAEQALQAARFNAASLGLQTLPTQLCLDLRYQETAEAGEHVQLRRLNARLNERSGAASCLGATPH